MGASDAVAPAAAAVSATPMPLALEGALLAKLNATNRRTNYAFLAEPDGRTESRCEPSD